MARVAASHRIRRAEPKESVACLLGYALSVPLSLPVQLILYKRRKLLLPSQLTACRITGTSKTSEKCAITCCLTVSTERRCPNSICIEVTALS